MTIYKNILSGRFPMPPKLRAISKDILSRLLTVSPITRLGGALPKGSRAVMEHPFFKPHDWNRLETRQYAAPWRPALKEKFDTSYFGLSEQQSSPDNDTPRRLEAELFPEQELDSATVAEIARLDACFSQM